MTYRILLVEDTRFFAQFVLNCLTPEMGFQVDWAQSMAEAKSLCRQYGMEYDLALLDLGLPDAPNGEIVPYCLNFDIPAVIFSGIYDKDMHKKYLEMGVVDYVVKDSPISLDFLIKLVNRLTRNTKTKALIAGGDIMIQAKLAELLSRSLIQSINLVSMTECLDILAERKDFGLILIAGEMEDGTSFEFLKQIRNKSKYKHIPILVIDDEDHIDSTKFLKYGANDCIHLPIRENDFLTRVHAALTIQDQLKDLEHMAATDSLTGLLNRRAFRKNTQILLSQLHRGQINLTLAIFDIDHFKKVNDNFGHDAGDIVIKTIARELKRLSRGTDVIARLGGEEFAGLYVNLSTDHIDKHFESIRKSIEDLVIDLPDGKTLTITISTGITVLTTENLDEAIKIADTALYEAKKAGRNCVKIGDKKSPSE